MRIARRMLGLQSDQREQLRDTLCERAPAQNATHQQRLADALADRHFRIERRIRVLKDDLHITLRVAQRSGIEPCQIVAEEFDLA